MSNSGSISEIDLLVGGKGGVIGVNITAAEVYLISASNL